MEEKDFDFVAVGDIVTDAFIRLKNAELHCDVKHEDCEICMAFGAKLPYESVTVVPAVGNSPNAAVVAARLGLTSAVVTDLGDDYYGHESTEALKRKNVDTQFVHVHAGHVTNYHYVLWYADDRTILIKHQEYPYVLPDIGAPKWLYLSSLGEHSLPYHQSLAQYLEARPQIKLAFQPGTFQIKFGTENLSEIYHRTEVLLCNLNEAQKILKIETNEVKILLQKLHELGPKIVVITDGAKGAYVSDSDSSGTIIRQFFMPPYPDPKPPLERTGAGDAFSATFVAALALGKSVEAAVAWAPINSMSVVQQIGAQAGLLTRTKLEEFLAQAPTDYKPKNI